MSTIQYSVGFESAHSHSVRIEALYPTGGTARLDLMMAVWTPGSYLIREYARQVERVRAAGPDGRPLEIRKTHKNRWRVETGGNESVRVRYHVYCREMTVRTNWVDNDFALLNGAPTFLTLVEGQDLDHDVHLQLPEHWKHSISGLAHHPEGGQHSYRASSFDDLVDSPILAGNPAIYQFEVDGKPHFLVNQGEAGVWDGPGSARDVEVIVRHNLEFWGSLPYRRYVFMNLIVEGTGGLEHKNSTVMMTSRWTSGVPERYRKWLGLVSHEYFHTWNVKRLRPLELGPFDYEREVHTESLWVAEGLTSYYDDLLLCRSGLFTPGQYLDALSEIIARVQHTPGRRVRSLHQSSFDAWIKHYRPDENSVNTTVSYYAKGAVVGFLLDARLRRLTDGSRSLDDLMRLALDRYSGARGYSAAQFRQAASEVADVDLQEWFREVLEETTELDYSEALDLYGLEFSQASAGPTGPGDTPEAQGESWLGVTLTNRGGSPFVKEVVNETARLGPGLEVGDEILALDGFRATEASWRERMQRYQPGAKVRTLVSRRERLVELEVEVQPALRNTWRLTVKENPTPVQTKRLREWLHIEKSIGTD